MHAIPGVVSSSPDTVADMTLRLDIVREIPALTGDMRPDFAAGQAGSIELTGHGFDGEELVPLQPAFMGTLNPES